MMAIIVQSTVVLTVCESTQRFRALMMIYNHVGQRIFANKTRLDFLNYYLQMMSFKRYIAEMFIDGKRCNGL